MPKISPKKLLTYRANSYHIDPGSRVKNIQDAVAYIKERGFVFFWPIKGVEMPSLWKAVAGDRPVANAHDDPGHITWGWKDQSLGKRLWYYGKILRRKSMMVDFDLVPYFYALTENFGNPVEDIQIQYLDGRISKAEKAIFDVLHENGPLDTIAIRKAVRMTSKESNSKFDSSISSLQSGFKILPVGISDSGGWRYAFIYDLVHRYYPEIPKAARNISEKKAREKLIETYLQSVGAAQLRDLFRLFQWEKKSITQAVDRLIETGIIIGGLEYQDETGEWFAIEQLI